MDVSANLPDAVKKQVVAAKKLQEKLTSEGTPSEKEPVKATPPATPAPEKPPEAEPVEPQVMPKVESKPIDYEQMYKVLKGKFDAQDPAQKGQITQLTDSLSRANSTINHLNDLIVDVQTKPQGEPDNGGEPGSQPEVDLALDVEDFGDYGDEMQSAVKMINKLVTENAGLKSQIGDVAGQVESNTRITQNIESDKVTDFNSDLTGLVSDWKVLNNDPGFNAWLAQPDEATGITRQDLLVHAHKNRDVTRVAGWFNAWKTASGVPAETTPPLNPDTPPNAPIAGEVMPDSSSATPQAPVPDGSTNVVTREEYNEAAKNASLGKMTPEDFKAITVLFQKNIKEGKV